MYCTMLWIPWTKLEINQLYAELLTNFGVENNIMPGQWETMVFQEESVLVKYLYNFGNLNKSMGFFYFYPMPILYYIL